EKRRIVSGGNRSDQEDRRKPDRSIPSTRSPKASQPDDSNSSQDGYHSGDKINRRNPSHSGATTEAPGGANPVDSGPPQELFSALYEAMLKGPLMKCLTE